ncbi:hypothetical protein Y032_0466g1980 [Ancylostoma ceylanicum]|uniref:Uncharacterized protein n=1 Tax=Ancylostoma ceylanicum TaxID=53326 RepID=A0A016WZ42_9BILA|nr:hypothetical protein Y032_0466g1980 [Ancylostoma ceylanicum]
MDRNFPFVTISGAKKAFTFFEHIVTMLYPRLDVSLVTVQIKRLNEINNEVANSAKTNSLEEATAMMYQSKIVVLLAEGLKE